LFDLENFARKPLTLQTDVVYDALIRSGIKIGHLASTRFPKIVLSRKELTLWRFEDIT